MPHAGSVRVWSFIVEHFGAHGNATRKTAELKRPLERMRRNVGARVLHLLPVAEMVDEASDNGGDDALPLRRASDLADVHGPRWQFEGLHPIATLFDCRINVGAYGSILPQQRTYIRCFEVRRLDTTLPSGRQTRMAMAAQ